MGTPALRLRPEPADPALVDHFVTLRGVSFKEYETMLRWRGDSATPRMTYLEGTLELMTPSIFHELGKKALARVIEAWSEEAVVPLEGARSWTLKARKDERGAEPDECYFVMRPGRSLTSAKHPDFAIEVIWTRGGIDKLEVYRKLGVPEVWILEKGKLTFHVLRGSAWRTTRRSVMVPTLDPSHVEAAMREPTQVEAVRRIRELMRGGK